MLFRLCRAMWDSDRGVLFFGLSSTVAHCSVGWIVPSVWLLYDHTPPPSLHHAYPHGTYTSHEYEVPQGGTGCGTALKVLQSLRQIVVAPS